jgi:TP901 family phage tail tape measure protein
MSLGITLTLKDLASGGLNKLIGNVNTNMSRLQEVTRKTSAVLAGVGAASVAAGYGISRGIAKPVISAFADLEQAQASLQSTMMQAGSKIPETFAGIDKLAIELGNALPGTTSDFYQMFEVLNRQGIDAQTQLDGLGRATAYLGVVAKLNYPLAAELTAKLSKNAGIAANDMLAFTDQLQRALHMGIDPTEITYAFARGGAALKQFGLQGLAASKDVNALFSILVPALNSGETTGSGFGATLKEIMDVKQLAKANALMASFGKTSKMAFANTSGNFAGIDNMVAQFDKMNGLNDTQKMQVMEALVGKNNEAQSVVSAIMLKGVKGWNEQKERLAQQASLQERTDRMLSTLTNLWDAVTGTFTNILASIGESISGDLKNAVAWMGRLEEKAIQFIKLHPDLVRFGAAFSAISAVVLPLLGSFMLISGAIVNIAGKLRYLFSPWTLVLALIVNYWEQISSFVGGFIDGLMVGLSPVIKLFDGFGSKLSVLIEKITGVKVATDASAYSWQIWGENAGIAIGSVASDITDLLGKWYAFVYFKLDDRAKDYQEWINKIKAVFSGFFDWLDEKFKAISSFLITASNGLNAILPESMQSHIEPIKSIASADLMGAVSGNNASQPRGGDVIHFSPNITLPAGTSEQTVSSVKQALGISQTEFEQRYKTMMKQQTRTGYAAQ